MPEPRTTLKPYVLILLLAVVLRAGWAALVPVVPVSDCHSYDVCAQNLAVFNTFGYEPDKPWAFWPVGASFAYSLIYRVFDPMQFGYLPVAVFNGLLGTALVGLAMAAAHRWFGRTPALWAGLILAIWPTQVFFTTIIASETLFTALCLAGVLAWPNRVAWPRLILAGVLFAGASYVRPTALLLPIVLAGAAWLRAPRTIGTAAASAAVALLTMAILIAPWTARNRHVFGRTVLISTNGGTNLWMGNNPTTTGEYQQYPELPGKNEAERDAHFRSEARKFIISDPVGFLKRTVYKGLRLHATETIGVGWNIEGLKRAAPGLILDERATAVRALKGLSTGYWLVILLLSIPGLVILARQQGAWQAFTHPAIALWAYFALLHAVIVIQDRYHLPFTPMVASLAGLTLATIWQRFRAPVPA